MVLCGDATPAKGLVAMSDLFYARFGTPLAVPVRKSPPEAMIGMKASDITDERIIEIIKKVCLPYGSTILWDIQKELVEYPEKVVLAKLKSMCKREVIDGCACGCRGDFRLKGEQ
jgi:hypothetical protein